MSWEDTFKTWGQPPKKTEQEKMENTESAIKKAISNNVKLSTMDISVFAQGSYKARTNVRQDSDVDVCVCLNSTFFPRYPSGKTKEDFGNIDGSISYSEFKNLVEGALRNHFDTQNVTRGNKAFDIQANTYRVNADVLPAFAYKYYYYNAQYGWDHVDPTGVAFKPDVGERINNWPKQAYENGVKKQKNTGERFKKMVRILKTIRNKMQEEGIQGANDVPSFLIESMVWNVPDDRFNKDTYYDDMKNVVANCFNQTLNGGKCKYLKEANGIKYLFRPAQPWTHEQAHSFFDAAWDYVGFE